MNPSNSFFNINTVSKDFKLLFGMFNYGLIENKTSKLVEPPPMFMVFMFMLSRICLLLVMFVYPFSIYQQYHVNGVAYSLTFFSFLSSPKIFSGLDIDEFSRKKLDLTAQELSEEKELAYSCLS